MISSLEQSFRLRKFIQDETPREIDGIPLKGLPSLHDPRNYIFTAVTPIPEKVDWNSLPEESRNRDIVDFYDIDQGQFGMCGASSANGGFFTKIAHDSKTFEGPFSDYFFYSVLNNMCGHPEVPGVDLLTVMKAAQKIGTVPDYLYPTSQMTRDVNLPMPPSDIIAKAAKWRIDNYAAIMQLTDTNREELVKVMCAALAAGYILQVGVIVCENFMDIKGPDYIIPIPNGRILGFHAMRLIDYNKKIGVLTKNTWSKRNWGNNNWAWFSFDWFIEYLDLLGDGRAKWYYVSEVWSAVGKVQPSVAKPKHHIVMWINKPTALVDGKEVPIDKDNPKITPKVEGGRTLIPIRFLSENCGDEIEWNAKEQRIDIYRY